MELGEPLQPQLDSIFRVLSGPDGQTMNEVGPGAVLFLMGVSLASSLFIAWLYLCFYSNRATGSQVHRAFPLLGISITAIFFAIQFSLLLSLGLLGALSIVRFRTPIKEPEEIGFIMLVIAAALACATFNLAFLEIILIVAVAALLVQRFATGLFHGAAGGGLIVVSVPHQDDNGSTRQIPDLLATKLRKGRLESLSRNDDSTVISYAFRGSPQKTLVALQSELQERSTGSTVNIFFNRAGAL